MVPHVTDQLVAVQGVRLNVTVDPSDTLLLPVMLQLTGGGGCAFVIVTHNIVSIRSIAGANHTKFTFLITHMSFKSCSSIYL